MRLLRRNCVNFEYLPRTGNTNDLNENGEHTGEYHPEYGRPIPYRGNISTPNGTTSYQFYGIEARYTHTLVMDDPNAVIREDGVVRWNGELYDVTAVRPSLNGLTAALKKQSVNEEAWA